MQRDDSILLGHIFDTATNIANRLREVSRDEFDSNQDLRFAIAYQVQIIGEAASKISVSFRLANPQIPWERMIGMRHRIVHDYTQVNYKVLWRAAKHDVVVLIEAVRPLVDQ